MTEENVIPISEIPSIERGSISLYPVVAKFERKIKNRTFAITLVSVRNQVAASSTCFREDRRLTDMFTSRAALWVRICCRLSSAALRSRRSPFRWISKIGFRSRSADNR